MSERRPAPADTERDESALELDADAPLSALELEALASWELEPAPSVADRVMQALDAPPAEPKPRPSWRRLAIAASLLLGVGVAGVTAWQRWGRPSTKLVAGPPASVQRVEADQALPVTLSSDIEAWVAQFGRRYGVAFRFSGVVAVRRGEQTTVLGFGRLGVLDEGLPGAATQFRIGALTQPMVAVALERMVMRGELRLEDSLGQHIPGLPAAWRTITLEQLVRHQSGIPNFTDSISWMLRQGEVHDPEELWGYVANEKLHFAPGHDFEASNTNFVLLGEVMARRAGSSIDEVLRSEVFVPAGMKRARMGLGDPRTAADGMSFDEDEILIPADRVAPSALGAAGGVVASAEDLLAFDAALREGELLPERRLREMYKGMGRYGRGWASRWVEGDFEVGHPGGLDGFNAQFTRRLADATTVVVLANTDAVDARVVSEGIMSVVDGVRPQAPLEREERVVPAERLEVYVGDYAMSEATRKAYWGKLPEAELGRLDRVRVHRRASTLWLEVPSHADKWLHGFGADQFFVKDRSGTLARFEASDPRRPDDFDRLVLQLGETRFEFERVQ